MVKTEDEFLVREQDMAKGMTKERCWRWTDRQRGGPHRFVAATIGERNCAANGRAIVFDPRAVQISSVLCWSQGRKLPERLSCSWRPRGVDNRVRGGCTGRLEQISIAGTRSSGAC